MVMSETIKTRLAGLIGVVLVLSAVGVTLGVYQKVFVSSVDVVVQSDRAGLLLEKGSKVRAYGLDIGEVSKVELLDDDTVQITLAIRPDEAERLPADARANISASTIFGAKYVELQVPESAGSATLAGGETLQAIEVGTEMNDVFAGLNEVLDAIDPQQLNATLNSVAGALDGRGERLGATLVQSDAYFAALNGHSEQLSDAIDRSAGVLQTYSDVAPQWLEIADSASVTTDTISARSDSLLGSLQSLTVASGQAQDFFVSIAEPLELSMDRLRPVLALTTRYEEVLTCIVRGLDYHNRYPAQGLGSVRPGIQGNATLLPAAKPYTYENNLPKFALDAEPRCFGLEDGEHDPFPGRAYFDDGTNEGVWSTENTPFRVSDDPVTIYTGLLDQFFGEAGVLQLLGIENVPQETSPGGTP